MRLGIIRLYTGESGKIGYYNIQEVGLAKELAAKLDLDIFVFILRDKFKYPKSEIINIEEKVKLVYIPVLSLGNHGLLNPTILHKFQLDLIQVNSDNQIGCYKVIKWALNKKIPIYTYIGTIDSDSKSKFKNMMARIIFKRNYKMMKKIINVAKTPLVFSKLKNLGLNNSTIIPVGLDIDNFAEFNKINSYQNIRSNYGLPIDKKILLFVGRLEEYKKPFKVLDIFNYIKQKDDKYHLLVVGDGSLNSDFFEKAKDLNLKDHITHIKKIENKYIKDIYSISDVLINTNDQEIYGMSILEAMYCGCPVVAKSAPGPTYIINDGYTGYILDSYNEEMWYGKIESVLLNREKFSLNSKSRIEMNFTWQIICKEYNNLFNYIQR